MFKINDFISINLDERFTNKNVDFVCQLTPKRCQHLSFEQAIDFTIDQICKQHDKIYIALSGGADSECVVRAFHRNNVDFDVIIVNTGLNRQEISYGLLACQELKITPIIINVSEQQYFTEFYENIYKPINGTAFPSALPFIAGRYALEKGGILLTGDNHMDDRINTTQVGTLEMGEWEFYNHILLPGSTICFYAATLELLRSLCVFDIPNFDRFKCIVYNVKKRPKTGYTFTDKQILKMCRSISKRNIPIRYSMPMTKKQFLDAT